MQEIGRSIIRLESVDSTNNYTANRARENDLRHGAVILAVEQTAGKGQMGAHWRSEAGLNLTFSVFLDNVNLSVERQFLLTKIVSLSLVDLLDNFGVSAKIKWPNDIYVHDRKIAGVLIENTILGKNIARSIVGIGLNVNQKDFGTLAATSLALEKQTYFSIDDVLFSFIGAFNKRMQVMESPMIQEEYHRLLYWLGEERKFKDADGVFDGIIRGTTEAGLLEVESGLREPQPSSLKREKEELRNHIERSCPEPAKGSRDVRYYNLKEIQFLS